ncbi:zinc finger, CCHC-type containing protein [Tanacetum coccineum]
MAAAAMKHMALNLVKLDKFKMVDFRRWQKKMHFLLFSMSVVYVLTTPIPEDGGDDATVEQIRKRTKWDNDDYDSLEAKYMVEDVSSKKFLVSNFTNYKMTDSIPVLEQYNELFGRLESYLRIEESLRVQDSDKPKGNNVVGPSVVNMVEHNNSSRYNDNKGKRKHHDNTKADPNKKSKVTCWKCEKPEHLKKDCKGGKVGNKSNDSGTNTYFVQDDDVAWWVDSGATVHVCKDRCWFKTYESLNDGSILHMGNESTALVHGRGCVDLRFNIVNDNIASAFMSTSKLNDSIIWHARLGHVHFKRMQDMSKDGLILDFNMCGLKRNKKYFVTFIDDASRFCYVYLLHSKDEALDKFKVFKTEVELQQGSQIKRFRTNRGGEYMDTLYFQNESKHSKAFRFYVIEQNESVSINFIIESRDAIFDENNSLQSPYQVLGFLMELKTLVFQCSLKRSLKTLYDVSDQHSYCFNVEDEPKTFDEAMKSQDVAFWKEAINDEMDSIIGNNTWVLADLPPGCKPLSCKWIFKRKLKVDGTIEKFKARLVIQSFKQKSGIDYFDTYAPVARISTIRLLIAMASIHNLVIHQMDVKTCLLGNDDLVEEQTPKQWHQKFDEVVLSNGYLLNQADKCVYSKFDESGKGVIICIYVDDMLIFGTDQVQVDLTKDFFVIKSYYIKKVLKKFNYFDCTLVSTPMDTSEKLMPNNGQAVSQLEYSRVIGCLMYAMTCIRPDIAFAVGKLSRYTSNSNTQHWQAIQRVLKYLKKTMDYKLTYTGYPSVLEGYTDASWISNSEDNSSTMESKFMALAAADKEAEWLRNLILEIPLWSKPIAPILIRCDSAATLARAYSQLYNEKSRHLGVRHSMIRELITNGVISIEFVRSQQNLADHLTKGLARDLVIKLLPMNASLEDCRQHYCARSDRCCLPGRELSEAVAEIVTTFLLVFVTCGAASLSTKDDHKVPQLGASVASWLIMTVMIYVGHFFGEHMNLAVTLAVGSGLQDCIVRIASASLDVGIIKDLCVHPWGGLTTTKDSQIDIIVQNIFVFDNARSKERECELLYSDA